MSCARRRVRAQGLGCFPTLVGHHTLSGIDYCGTPGLSAGSHSSLKFDSGSAPSEDPANIGHLRMSRLGASVQAILENAPQLSSMLNSKCKFR